MKNEEREREKKVAGRNERQGVLKGGPNIFWL
jgi:hypothetical protein